MSSSLAACGSDEDENDEDDQSFRTLRSTTMTPTDVYIIRFDRHYLG
jgi:hypothetical protein